jgi:4-carboxymuconolactone decarboxylase
MANEERLKRGNDMRVKLFGDSPPPSENFKDIMEVTVGHLFGDIWTRPGLATRDRSFATITALTALGKEAQLKVHMRGALNVGVTREEVKELMIHLAHYAGWPCAMVGMKVADEVFKELDEKEA